MVAAIRLSLVATAISVWHSAIVHAQLPDTRAVPAAIPKSVVEAWLSSEQGSAHFWVRQLDPGFEYFRTKTLHEQQRQPGDRSRFAFYRFIPGRLAQLPRPPVPFGLALAYEVGSGELAELKGMDQLHWLALQSRVSLDNGVKNLDALPNLEELSLAGDFTDAGLRNLCALPSLQKNLLQLTLSRSKITDTGLKELTSLKHLRTLALGQTNVSDAGMKELATLASLQTLDLSGLPLTAAGLKDLAASPSLQVLIFEDNDAVNDAALVELVRLPKLQVLYLTHTAVTDAGAKELARMSNLDTLCLERTAISDVALKELIPLPNLRKLILGNNQSVRAGIKAMSQMKSLRIVYAYEPPGGEPVMKYIRSRVPQAKIVFRQGNYDY
jgi:hypothetical protein